VTLQIVALLMILIYDHDMFTAQAIGFLPMYTNLYVMNYGKNANNLTTSETKKWQF
jgi:hypothetical protein